MIRLGRGGLSAEEALDFLKDEFYKGYGGSMDEYSAKVLCAAICALDRQIPADADARTAGGDTRYYTCPVCNNMINALKLTRREMYCSNCGKKLKKLDISEYEKGILL